MHFPDRRAVMQKLLALSVTPLLQPLITHSVEAGEDGLETAADVLKTFLEHEFVTPSMQCGARLGDGVPAHEDVIRFLDDAVALATSGAHHLSRRLQNSRQDDLTAERVMIVDGWILSRTEALAASAYVLLTGSDCEIDEPAQQQNG